MLTTEFKERILKAIEADRTNFNTDNAQSIALGINNAQLSRIKKGENNVLADEKWISIARKLKVSPNNAPEWKTAKTPTLDFILQQLEFCKQNSSAGLLCDEADIGKTHAAQLFAKSNKYTVYIDCSQVKSKQKLVRQIAKEFGMTHTGKYSEVYEDLVYYLNVIEKPLVILDEAGDLDYPAFLELKALWNATERACGWYMMGADGLKVKINNNLGRRKVGYTEIFSRYGKSFQKVVPEGKDAMEEFKKIQTALIAKANGSDANGQRLYAKTDGSLRKLRTEIQKQH